MIHIIGRGSGYIVVVSAADMEAVAKTIHDLFQGAGKEPVEMEFMEFDPTKCGGVLAEVKP